MELFANPTLPDRKACRDDRHYRQETSQISGRFYSALGRRELLRQVVDMMLQHADPYDALTSANAAPRQQLRLVSWIAPHTALTALIHAALIAFPRQYDHISRRTCPPAVAVDRLATCQLPKPGLPWHLLAKLQGAFTSQFHLWR